MNAPANPSEDRDRDALSLLLVGSFFAVLAVLVLIGTWWTLERPRAAWVNVVSGALLMAIGLGMVAMGLRMRRRAAPERSRP